MQKQFDPWMVIATVGLTLFSLFTIFGVRRELFLHQLLFFIVGYIFLVLFFYLGIDFFRLNSVSIYGLFLFFLVVTFIFGETVRGSKRWIDFYFIKFQSSEFFKPFLTLLLADLFASKRGNKEKFILSFIAFLIPTLIIFKQPDLGNALVYSGVYFFLLFFAGFPLVLFIYGFIIATLMAPLLWKVFKSYQKARIISFLNPEAYHKDIAYNVIQSVITVGSGAIIGRGLGLGTQSRFLFLPENHTDFAFASLVEQFGFVGGALVMLFFAILVYRLLLKVRRSKKDSFHFLFITGIILFLMLSIFINIAMNLGLVPATGIALPLISYGGSSIVSTFIMLGLAMSI